MQEHTYAFLPDYSKKIVPLNNKKNGLRRPATRDQIFTRGQGRTDEENAQLDQLFKAVDFDDTEQRERVIDHIVKLLLEHPSIEEISYVAQRWGFDAGKLGYNLDMRLENEGIDGGFDIEQHDDVQFGWDGMEAQLIRGLSLVTLTRVRANE